LSNTTLLNYGWRYTTWLVALLNPLSAALYRSARPAGEWACYVVVADKWPE